MVKTINTGFSSPAMSTSVNPGPSSTVISREMPPPSTLNINITTSTLSTPQDATATQNLECRIAAIENSLADITKSVTRSLNAHIEDGCQLDDVVVRDKACKDATSQVDAIVGEFRAVNNSLAKIVELMTEHERVQINTEMDGKVLFNELEEASHNWQVILELFKQKSNTSNSTVESSELSEERTEEESDGESDEEHEEVEKDAEVLDNGERSEIISSLNEILAALDAESKGRCIAHSRIEATAYRFHGIDALLQQQKHTQSRIARNTERSSEDLSYAIDVLENLGTAMRKQGKSIDLMLRRQSQVEDSLCEVRDIVGLGKSECDS